MYRRFGPNHRMWMETTTRAQIIYSYRYSWPLFAAVYNVGACQNREYSLIGGPFEIIRPILVVYNKEQTSSTTTRQLNRVRRCYPTMQCERVHEVDCSDLYKLVDQIYEADRNLAINLDDIVLQFSAKMRTKVIYHSFHNAVEYYDAAAKRLRDKQLT